MIRQWVRFVFSVLLTTTWALAFSAPASAGNSLEQLNAAASGDQVTLRLTFRDPVSTTPPGFSTSNPARVALDLVGATSALAKNSQSLNQGYLRSVNLAQTDDRLRVVLNLERAATYQLRADGRDLFVTLTAVAAGDPASAGRTVQFAPPPVVTGKVAQVRDVSFRRGADGEGKVVVELDDPNVGVDVKKQGQSLIVEFSGTNLPEALAKKMDVNDFATPVSAVTTTQQGDKVRMVVTPRGNWDHVAYQSDTQFVLEVRPVIEDPNKLGGGVRKYQGEKLSLRFRDYPVKEVLQAFSDFSGLNVVVSESVSGTINLNLQDVPWEQALDIILEQKNLALKKNGNVLMIAPRDEILARNKVSTEAAAFEPTGDATFQVNYLRAVDAKTRVTDYFALDPQKTSTVKVMADPASNKLFVKATESALEEVRRILREIDLPPRQVLIEARIVEASDDFSRDLGVRLGYSDLNFKETGGPFGTGQIETLVPVVDPATGEVTSEKRFLPFTKAGNILGGDNTSLRGNSTANVNLPATSLGNALSFFLTNKAMTRLLAVELTALEVDGRGKIVSSPRVLAQNGQEARIEDGQEIPYQQASSSGATNVSFKKATLSLSVTPTINADGRIAMELKVNKDSPGVNVPGGLAINTKQLTTKVVVENGGTVVVGGVFSEDERNDESKIPLLGDLPYVGFLFKQRSRSTKRAELLVFITPRIVSDQLTLQ